jgi:glycine cleavage system H protein
MSEKINIPENYRFTKDHEWIVRDSKNDNIAIVGISDHAQAALGDIVHVELPDEGQSFEVGDEVAVVESAKSASEVYTPVSGSIIEVNDSLDSAPELVNEDPYGEGWLFKIELDDPDQLDDLLSSDGYISFLDEE